MSPKKDTRTFLGNEKARHLKTMSENSKRAVRSKFHTGYRTAFHFDLRPRETTLSVAVATMRSWLNTKGIDKNLLDGWDGQSTVSFPGGMRIDVAGFSNMQDGSEGILYRVFDHNGGTIYRTTIYAVDRADAKDSATAFVIEGATDQGTADEAIDSIRTTRMVKDLLNSRRVFDSVTRLQGTPRVVHADDVREVFDAIFDKGRQIAVVVASSVGREADENWRKVVESLTRDSVGTAATFVVTADAVGPLNDMLPDHLQVGRGRIRTFMPKVSAEEESDGIRHRYVGPETLANALRGGGGTNVKGFLPTLHARSTRRPLLDKGFPTWLNRRLRRLEEEERRLSRSLEVRERVARKRGEAETAAVRSIAVAAPPQPLRRERMRSGARDWWDTFRNRVAEWLGKEASALTEETFEKALEELGDVIATDRETLSYHQELVEEADREISELQENVALKADQLGSIEEDSAFLQLELDEIRAKNAYLRKRLADSNIYGDVDISEDDDNFWEGVDSLDEVLAKLEDEKAPTVIREHIQFTGDMKTIDNLVRRDHHGAYARETWSMIRTLASFIEAVYSGGDTLTVERYLKDEQAIGYRVSARRHAPRESESVRTNARWIAEREFPVPRNVDPSERALMEAHFRIGHGDSVAPRMYYLDRLAEDGKVYIGYIGPHLTNTKTN